MSKLENLEFGGSVADKQSDTQGEKIDTTPENEKEQEDQDKVADAMENDEDISNDDINADTPGDDSDDVDSSDEDEEEEAEEEESEDEEEEEEEGEKPDSEADTESEEGELPDKKDSEETLTKDSGEIDYSKLKEIENNSDLPDEVKEQRVMQTFLDLHKDIIPESARINFQKFIDSDRNSAFLYADDNLYKLVMEVRNYRDDLPLSDRLSKAFKVVFSQKLASNERKKGEVKAEIRSQKVNKAVITPAKSDTSKQTKGTLDPEQKRVMKQMGISEKEYSKYGKL